MKFIFRENTRSLHLVVLKKYESNVTFMKSDVFHLFTQQVVRLLYTNNGIALLSLGSNAIHKLWKWQRSERNPNGKVE